MASIVKKIKIITNVLKLKRTNIIFCLNIVSFNFLIPIFIVFLIFKNKYNKNCYIS